MIPFFPQVQIRYLTIIIDVQWITFVFNDSISKCGRIWKIIRGAIWGGTNLGTRGACQVLSPLLGAPTKKHHGVGGLKKQTNYHTLEKKKKIWIGINFNFLFIFGFLRWGHKILHADSNGVSGPYGRILASWMPFPATNRILNFIFLQKFLPFCPFLTIFFFLRTKIKPNVIKFYTMIF